MSEKAVKIFFSYAHEDEDLRDELAKHLKLMQRQGIIKTWHDREITAGQEWAGEIDANLVEADVILLLVSSDFLFSDYCWDVELKKAMERHKKGEAVVIPIILRSCDWFSAPFGKLQALPKNAEPVTKWNDRDEAFLDVARGIKKLVENLTGGRGKQMNIVAPVTQNTNQENLQSKESDDAIANLYKEKITRLKKAYVLETDTARKFQLENQINEGEKELDNYLKSK